MQSVKPTCRSRPLTLARPPMISMILPSPPSRSPMALQALRPRSMLSARTTMNTLPLSGRVSMVTTGIPCPARRSSVEAMAPVSCGAMTMAFAPWLTTACALATSFCTSFCEFVVVRSMPSSASELRHILGIGRPEIGVVAGNVDGDLAVACGAAPPATANVSIVPHSAARARYFLTCECIVRSSRYLLVLV